MKYGLYYHNRQKILKVDGIWDAIVTINGAIQAIALALLVIFFLVGVVKTCGSFAEVKKPEQVLKLFLRFAISKAVVTYGLEIMLYIFKLSHFIFLNNGLCLLVDLLNQGHIALTDIGDR